jgi:hypothetical protein
MMARSLPVQRRREKFRNRIARMRKPLLAIALLSVAAQAAAQNLLSRGSAVFPVPHTGGDANGIARIPVAAPTASGPTPFSATCGLSGGTLYMNAEVEPWLAIDPTNDRHWIAVWQQDRWSNGSSRGLVTGVTFDAGATWTRVAPRFSVCAGGTYTRASDPWVDFSPNGVAWQIGLVTSGTSFTATSINAVVVSRSTDGGLSWSDPVEIIHDEGSTFFNDKETLTADPHDPGFVYAVWDRLRPNGGPAYFARTTNGGVSWEPARPIHDPGNGQQTIGNLIRVLPDGTLVNLFTHIKGGSGEEEEEKEAPDDATLEVLRSTDRGATWTGPHVIAEYQPAGAKDPATGAAIRDGTPIGAMAVGPDGTLYVVWQDARISPDPERDDILLARSTNGGVTWSTPVRVNRVPGRSAFAPQVHVAADGMIGVTYFDLRSDTADETTLPTDYWLARSQDGVTWTETHLAGPFDLQQAPLAGGFFLGDYMGLASAAGEFVALHARATGNAFNRTDIFATRVATNVPGIVYTAVEAKSARADADFRAKVARTLKDALARRRASLMEGSQP